jgi:hypothetical protein
MPGFIQTFVSFYLLNLPFVYSSASKYGSFNVRPFKVDLSAGVPRMLDLVKNTRLPEKPEYPGVASSFGIDLGVLRSLQNEWVHQYDWDKDQSYINK